jgi:hypothetical protein
MPTSATAMQPFLAQLPALDAAGRAKAVHFGHMPVGLPTRVAQAAPSASPSPQAAPADPPQTRLATRGTTPIPARPSGAIAASSRRTTARSEDHSSTRRQSGVPMRAPSGSRATLSATQPAVRKPEPAPPRLVASSPREAQPAPEPSRAGSAQLALSTATPAPRRRRRTHLRQRP